MINHTPFWFIFIMSCIIILQSVTPLSIAYSSILILLPPPHSYRLPSLLEYWAIAEALFYLAFYLYRTYYLQHPAVHSPLPPIEKRRELAECCLHNIPDYEKYISKWFLSVPLNNIKQENVKDFFRWAFLNTATADSAQEGEIEEYIQKLKEAIGREFQPGRSNVKCLRLTVDNATILHRSLIWYLVSKALTTSEMIQNLKGVIVLTSASDSVCLLWIPLHTLICSSTNSTFTAHLLLMHSPYFLQDLKPWSEHINRMPNNSHTDISLILPAISYRYCSFTALRSDCILTSIFWQN